MAIRAKAVLQDAGANIVVVWEDDTDGNGFYQIKARGFLADGSDGGFRLQRCAVSDDAVVPVEALLDRDVAFHVAAAVHDPGEHHAVGVVQFRVTVCQSPQGNGIASVLMGGWNFITLGVCFALSSLVLVAVEIEKALLRRGRLYGEAASR